MTYLAIILAAGKSSRMGNGLKKAFCEIGSEALIIHLIQNIVLSKPKQILIVINDTYTESDKKYILDYINQACECTFVYQNNPLGTGYSTKTAIDSIEEKDLYENVIVFYADTPLISENSIKNLLQKLNNSFTGLICGFSCNSDNQYGRIVLNSENEIEEIVEYKDYKNDLKVQQITKCNSGILAVKFDFLKNNLVKIQNNNQAAEYYLFDLIALADKKFIYFELGEDESIGINNLSELEKAELIWQNKQRNYWLQNFVHVVDKSCAYFGFNNKIGQGSKIGRGVVLGKNVEIGLNVEIQSYSVIGDDVKIADNTKIKPYSYIQTSTIGKNCEIGPFTNLNGDNTLADNNIVGNFVEIKRSTLGNNNKTKHLSYIGDGKIGNNNNFGAGCIFCNYDGKNKHDTTIGNENMIGANVSLVAPLVIGNENIVAAGSVINKGFDDNNLTIERGIQQIKKRKKDEDLSRN